MNVPTAPVAVSQLFEQARRYLLAGQIEQAEVQCKRVLKVQPRNTDALLVFALCRHDQGDFAGALKQLATALKLDPRSAALHLACGNSLRAMDRRNEAIEHYVKGARFNPNLVEAHANLGIVLAELGRHEEALSGYRQAVRCRPDYADAWLGMSHSLLELGRAQEALQVCDRLLQAQPDNADAHTNRGVALQLMNCPREAMFHFDRALQLNPAHPKALLNRTQLLIALGRPIEAIATIDDSLQRDPQCGSSWHQRGRALARCQRLEEAIACYQRGGDLDPGNDAIRYDLASALALSGRAGEALSVFEEIFQQRPDDAEAWRMRGHALALLGWLDDARASYERALTLSPGNPTIAFDRAHLDLLEGDLIAGWRGYEARWDDPRTGLRRRHLEVPEWDGTQQLAGRTLLVHHEQGLGDTLQFCRYLPILANRAGGLVFEVPLGLLSLLKRSLPPGVEVLAYGSPPPGSDFQVPLLSLPRVCATTLSSIPAICPYLRSDPERVAQWSARLGPAPKLRVGIAWSGNPSHGNDAQRSIALAQLAPLANAAIQWVALQTELRDSDRLALQALPNLVFAGDAVRDFDDSAALVELCDLVVTVDTSAAHLAGALGKPVWLLLPRLPDWRWLLERDDSPWYPTARLFRQDSPGGWASVIGLVAEELTGLLRQRRDPNALALYNEAVALGSARQYEQAELRYGASLQLEPGRVEAWVNRALVRRALGRSDDALADLDRALQVGTGETLAKAAVNRAGLLIELKRPLEALASAERALTILPGDAEARVNRAAARLALGQRAEALAELDQMLREQPGHGGALLIRGNGRMRQADLDGALEDFERLLRQQPDHAEARFSRALVHLVCGRLPQGFADYESRLEGAARQPDAPWLGQGDVAGRTVFVQEEQGLGDTLHFVRYVPMLAARGAHVVLRVQKPLAPLLRQFPGVERLLASGDAAPSYDLRVPLLSLPLAFGTDLATIPAAVPYLKADAEHAERWRRWLGPRSGMRVGLVWAGSTVHRMDAQRSVALSRLAPLQRCPVQFVALQPELRCGDAALLQQWNIRNAGPSLGDFADTAALVGELDLVITVDTAVAHLAGALGRPVWVLLPFIPDWRWMLEREDSPWYPSARLFRQAGLDDWDGVIARVAEQLSSCVKSGVDPDL